MAKKSNVVSYIVRKFTGYVCGIVSLHCYVIYLYCACVNNVSGQSSLDSGNMFASVPIASATGHYINWRLGPGSVEEGSISTSLGKIDEFDGSKEEWPQYVEHVDHFLLLTT